MHLIVLPFPAHVVRPLFRVFPPVDPPPPPRPAAVLRILSRRRRVVLRPRAAA